jgi:serine/threonine protein phosphatase PrpC
MQQEAPSSIDGRTSRPSRPDDTLPVLQPHDSAPGVVVGPQIDVAGASDVGKMRKKNEDQYVIAHLGRWMRVAETSIGTPERELTSPQGTLLVVADGMGGQGAGDVASAVTLDAFVEHSLLAMPWLTTGTPEGTAMLAADASRFLLDCQARLGAVAERKHLTPKLGTTLTAAYVSASGLVVMHVGDSRAYRLRERKLERLTHDHTLGEALGEPTGNLSHVLVNCVGGNAEPPKLEIASHAWRVGDRLLVCSDGLYGVVDDASIERVMIESRSARAAVDTLIAAALVGGGPDNVTAVVAFA